MTHSNDLQVALPEGATLSLTPAGIGVRFMAFAIDFLVKIVCFIAIALTIGNLGDFGEGFLLITLFVLEWLYPVIFEVISGATPGKKIYKIKVVQDNGLSLSFSSSLIRNLFRAIDFLPFAYVAGATTLLLNKKFQRIGDIVAGTLVVYEAADVKYQAKSDTRELHINIPLTLEQQRAILNFNERMDTFSEARANEMAELIAEHFPDNDYSPREKIQILASQLAGNK